MFQTHKSIVMELKTTKETIKLKGCSHFQTVLGGFQIFVSVAESFMLDPSFAIFSSQTIVCLVLCQVDSDSVVTVASSVCSVFLSGQTFGGDGAI